MTSQETEKCAHCGETYSLSDEKPGDLFGYCPDPKCQREGKAFEAAQAQADEKFEENYR